MTIHDIFSKRDKALPDVFQTKTIPEPLRNQILRILHDFFSPLDEPTAGLRRRTINNTIRTIRDAICRERGLAYLNNKGLPPEDDFAETVLCHGDTTLVLDIVDLSMHLVWVSDHHTWEKVREDLTRELNHRFRESGVGYQFDSNAKKLIPMDSLITHQKVVRPTLQLLAAKQYASANQEYLGAFDDYMKGGYEDCLTKCCSAFESVMKIICQEKGWPYDQTDTARPLLQTIVQRSGLPKFFNQPLTLIATMRNRMSSSHGSGTSPQTVPEHVARYALHATASAILLLVDASGV